MPRHIRKRGLRHGYNSKEGGLMNWSCKKEDISNLSCTKRGSWELN